MSHVSSAAQRARAPRAHFSLRGRVVAACLGCEEVVEIVSGGSVEMHDGARHRAERGSWARAPRVPHGSTRRAQIGRRCA